MPIYEYHCGACDGEFEVIQKISDRPKRKCELCGALKAKRKISQTTFVLKGSGWYATDYGSRKGVKAAQSKEKSDAISSSAVASESSDKVSKREPSKKADGAAAKKAS